VKCETTRGGQPNRAQAGRTAAAESLRLMIREAVTAFPLLTGQFPTAAAPAQTAQIQRPAAELNPHETS